MNYVSSARTNYFRVKSGAAFETLQDVAAATNARITTKHDKDKPATWKDPVALLWEESPYLDEIEMPNRQCTREGEEYLAPQDFESIVQPLLADKSVLVFQESGYEGMRYLTGFSWAIVGGKRRKTVCVDISDIYAKAAKAFRVPLKDITEAQY